MNQLPTPSNSDRTAAWYAGATWLRAAIGAIPYVGGSLDLVLSRRGQQLAQQRIEQMLAALEAEMHRVEAEALRTEFLDSEEWADLVRLSLERAGRVRSQEHLRAIARVLKGAAVGTIESASYAEVLVEVLAEIREEEALILRELYLREIAGDAREPMTDGSAEGFRSDELSLPPGLQERAAFLLKRLETSGLVDPGPMTFSGGFAGKYRPTQTGRELCRLVLGDHNL